MITWIEILEIAYEENYKDIFNKLGFSRYKEGNEPGKGSSFKFKNQDLKVQIITKDGETKAEISPLSGNEQFRSIDKYNGLINSNGSKLDQKGQAAFIASNYDKLKSMLDGNNYQATLNKVDSGK